MEDSQKDVLDLQIFITRSPGRKPIVYEGIPSFIIADEGRLRQTQQYRAVSNDYGRGETSPQADLAYIMVANSDAVEGGGFPFSPEAVLEMMNKLAHDRVNLLECMEFGAGLFSFVFNGSIRDLYRKLISQKKILRVTVATAIPELAILPWELMCDIKSGSFPKFLSYQTNIRLCRSLHLCNRSDFVAKKTLGDGKKLKILLATS